MPSQLHALEKTIFLCYSPADRAFARQVADFLESGAAGRVFFDEGAIGPGEDLAGKARQGRIADVVVVLFSRHSLPPRWPRAQWEGPLAQEPAEEGVRIAFLNCDGCNPPRVLAPQFTAEQLRRLKRWVRSPYAAWTPPADRENSPAALEALGTALADRAGMEVVADADLAFEFAQAFREDFDAVLFLTCGTRSLAALAGDLAAQLGLRLESPLDQNLDRLRDFCSARRLLLLLDEARPPEAAPLIFGGSCSTLICTAKGPETDPGALRAAQAELSNPGKQWEETCRQARTGLRLTREQGRNAESYELMRQWLEAAQRRNDLRVMDEASRELVWILEGWGMTAEARGFESRRLTDYAEQMVLFDVLEYQ